MPTHYLERRLLFYSPLCLVIVPRCEDHWVLLVIRFDPLADYGFERRVDMNVHTDDDDFLTRSPDTAV